MSDLEEKIKSIQIHTHKDRKARNRYGNCEWCSLLGDRYFIKFYHKPDDVFYVICACHLCMKSEPWKRNPDLVKRLHNTKHAKHSAYSLHPSKKIKFKKVTI